MDQNYKMQKPQNKLQFFLYVIFSLAALVILIDFCLPGRIENEKIINVQKERQQYYNAARNYHYSYKVNTTKESFLVSEDFAKLELENKKIEFSISRIFQEVNWYRLFSSENRAYYSLRIASGLVLPVLIITSLFVAFRFKKKTGTLIFILQVLLIADLVYLIM